MRKYFGNNIMVAILSCASLFGQVSPTMTAPNRKIAAPSPIAPRPAGAEHPETTAGTIEGYVYWNTRLHSHKPPLSCTGLAITVSVGSSSGPFTSYTPMVTLSNNFRYLGRVKEILSGGAENDYDVCTYGYNHVPVGPDLQVKLAVTDASVFSPAAIPQVAILGPIKIIDAQCAMLPHIMAPTLSDLTAHWGSCQDMAYNVNFVMNTPRQPLVGLDQAPPSPKTTLGAANPGPINLSRCAANPGPQQLSSGAINPGPTQLSRRSGNPGPIQLSSGARDPGPAQIPSQKPTSTSGSQLLSGSPQQGMFTGGVRNATQSNSGANGSLQSYTGTTRGSATLTNADVAAMLKAGLSESVIIRSIQSAKKNFDFSPGGCQALQRARVTPAIIAVMGDGSVRPCSTVIQNAPATPGSKVELNPQPYPPKNGITGSATTNSPGTKTELNPQPLPPRTDVGDSTVTPK